MKDRQVLVLALLGAVSLALVGCPVLTTEIRYEVTGIGTTWVGVIDYMAEHSEAHIGAQTLPWSYEFDTREDSLFLAVQARNEDFSQFTGTVTVRIVIDGEVAEADTSDSWPMAVYFWVR